MVAAMQKNGKPSLAKLIDLEALRGVHSDSLNIGMQLDAAKTEGKNGVDILFQRRAVGMHRTESHKAAVTVFRGIGNKAIDAFGLMRNGSD